MKCKLLYEDLKYVKQNKKVKRKKLIVYNNNTYYCFTLTHNLYKKVIDEYVNNGMIIIKGKNDCKKIEEALFKCIYTFRSTIYLLKHNIKYSCRNIAYMIKKPNNIDEASFINNLKNLFNNKQLIYIKQKITININNNKIKYTKTNKQLLYKRYKGVLRPFSNWIDLVCNYKHFSISKGEFEEGFSYKRRNNQNITIACITGFKYVDVNRKAQILG